MKAVNTVFFSSYHRQALYGDFFMTKCEATRNCSQAGLLSETSFFCSAATNNAVLPNKHHLRMNWSEDLSQLCTAKLR